ncbi:MAG: ketoacyl-ACP synthase III [Megasphaera sp.]|jgi:3-oxoacyl-[acyl-carrier-protein] synthase-3|nr:ketoacyl-ACP synthase III [Megasphaera sp.]MCH4187038.1 ketoacyl-ACP synthase III [Megasphaera sp.]MCH4217026.1 ketoacyl-ACP synthase III [Megasphaera sp.]
MIVKANPAGILGTGHYAPEQVWTNKDLEKMMDTSDEWIRSRTGIGARHVAPKGINTTEMATEAAKQAMEMAHVKPEELDLIILATLTPDRALPASSCKVQANLGAVNAAAFDLAAACSGFVYGAITAAQYIENGFYDKILVIGAEVLTRVINWKDRSSCILFGDGAGAAVIGRVPEGYGILGGAMGADGTGGDYLTIPASGVEMPPTDALRENGMAYAKMDGKEVYKFAVNAMPKAAKLALKRSDLTTADIDVLVPHQANIRIIQSAAKRLHIPMDKVYVNIERYANTSGASIPIALDEANRNGMIHRDDIVCLDGFGAGLTWSSLVMKWY